MHRVHFVYCPVRLVFRVRATAASDVIHCKYFCSVLSYLRRLRNTESLCILYFCQRKRIAFIVREPRIRAKLTYRFSTSNFVHKISDILINPRARNYNNPRSVVMASERFAAKYVSVARKKKYNTSEKLWLRVPQQFQYYVLWPKKKKKIFRESFRRWKWFFLNKLACFTGFL